MERLKRCIGCRELKPFSEFYSNRSSKDGHYHYCRECSLEIVKKSQARRKARLREIELRKQNPLEYADPRFKDFTTREIIEELRNRGCSGTVNFIDSRFRQFNL